jgi:hypothetical protein
MHEPHARVYIYYFLLFYNFQASTTEQMPALVNYKKLPPYTTAGLDLTTHSFSLHGGRRRRYHQTMPPGHLFLHVCSFEGQHYINMPCNIYIKYVHSQGWMPRLRGPKGPSLVRVTSGCRVLGFYSVYEWTIFPITFPTTDSPDTGCSSSLSDARCKKNSWKSS